MKRRVRRPEPVRVSPYFFQQLESHTEEAAAADHSSAVASGDDSASKFVGPITRTRAVDAALWREYTPDEFQSNYLSFIKQEHATTCGLEQQLADMWAGVERVMERNKVRREALQEERIDTMLTAVEDHMRFWTADEIVRCFKLETSLSFDGDTAAPPQPPSPYSAQETEEFLEATRAAHITLDFAVETAAGNDNIGKGKEEEEEGERKAGMHHANAWHLSDEELLDPSKRPHCIRRLFAPLLQSKDTLPKSLTLLLADLQKVQSTYLAALEDGIARGVLFNIPLYVPFQLIATCLNRHLAKENPSKQMEEDLLKLFVSPKHAMQKLRAYVEEQAGGRAALEETPVEERFDLAERMWELFFEELETHKRVDGDASDGYQTLTASSADNETALESAVDACDTASRTTLQQLQTDAEHCADAIAAVGKQTLVIVADMEREYEENKKNLHASIQAKAFALHKSEVQQEKLARRVREAMKDLYQEQLKYEETAQEFLQEKLTLAQLETSYAQLRQAIHSRHEAAMNAEKNATEVRTLLADADVSRCTIMTACRQHLGRMRTDNLYRRSRIISNTVTNAQQWSRCIHDMGHVYESRYCELDDKSAMSWQLSYLVAGERDWAANNLMDLRPELKQLTDAWAKVVPILEELDMDVPPSMAEDTAEDVEFRKALVLLDGPRKVQRQTTTLRQRKERMERAASGRGAAAALSIAEVNAAEARREQAETDAAVNLL